MAPAAAPLARAATRSATATIRADAGWPGGRGDRMGASRGGVGRDDDATGSAWEGWGSNSLRTARPGPIEELVILFAASAVLVQGPRHCTCKATYADMLAKMLKHVASL